MTRHASRSKFTAVLALAVALGACGNPPKSDQQTGGTGIPPLPNGTRNASEHSSDALNALSILESQAEQSGDPRKHAMQCAVALRTFSAQLEELPGIVSSSQKASLTRVQRIYDQQLASAAAKQGVSVQANRSEFEQNLQLGLDDPVPQVQRVAGCLRGLAQEGV